MATPPPPATRSLSKAPGAPDRAPKRQRPATTEKWVLLVPFDDPFRPVLADRALLEHYGCRSAAMLAHEAPRAEIEGRPAYNFYMSRSLLVAFLKSLTHGEFIYPKDVDADEVVRTFEYEGIAMPGNAITSDLPALGKGVQTLGQRMRRETKPSRFPAYVAQVVHALLSWPRLDAGLEEADRGGDPGFAASGTRVWVAFAPRPTVSHWPGGDDTYQLARKRPNWLNVHLQAIGQVHWRMVQNGRLEKDARDEQSFVVLARQGVEIHPASYYMSCVRDMPRNTRLQFRDETRHSDQFANWVCSTVSGHGEDKGQRMPEPVKYARVCIKLAIELIETAPDLTRVFGGQCTDPHRLNAQGKTAIDATPERAALAKALKPHGVRILAWSDEAPPRVANPLIFPPAYRMVPEPITPYVLLDCECKMPAREAGILV